MRIPDGYANQPPITSNATRTGAAGGAPPKASSDDTSSSGASAEKVTVSADAQRAAAQAESAKVDRLRSAINDGSFQIDTKAIASRIVDGG